MSLTALQTLLVREHNRLAAVIASQSAQLDDTAIYQKARKIVSAIVQAITYNEFLPAFMGPYAPQIGRYDESVDATLGDVFSAVGFRDGHSEVSAELWLVNDQGTTTTLPAAQAFYNVDLIKNGGIDPIVRGLSRHIMPEVDPYVIDDLRNLQVGGPPVDLVATDIQRARDHGIPSYNQVPSDFGLPPLGSFDEITSDTVVASNMAKVYGDISRLDPFVGMLAEDHLEDSSFGEMLTLVQREQFERLQRGDRFWYENDPALTADETQMIRGTRLSDLVRRNTTVTDVQENAFIVPE